MGKSNTQMIRDNSPPSNYATLWLIELSSKKTFYETNNYNSAIIIFNCKLQKK